VCSSGVPWLEVIRGWSGAGSDALKLGDRPFVGDVSRIQS
jgi:hypothetical protein